LFAGHHLDKKKRKAGKMSAMVKALYLSLLPEEKPDNNDSILGELEEKRQIKNL